VNVFRRFWIMSVLRYRYTRITRYTRGIIIIYLPGCSTDRSRLSNRCSLASSSAPLSPATPPHTPSSPPRNLSLIGRTALARSSRILTYASQAFNAHTSTRPTAVTFPPASIHAGWTNGGGPTAPYSVPLTAAAAWQRPNNATGTWMSQANAAAVVNAIAANPRGHGRLSSPVPKRPYIFSVGDMTRRSTGAQIRRMS